MRMATLSSPYDPAAAARLADWGVGPDDEALQMVRVQVAQHAGRLDDPGYSALRESYDDRQIVELLILAGWYHAVSYLDAGARLPAEPGTARFAQHRIEGDTP